ncbi:MAG TPA: RluA family pseudouridine synthase [Tissierellia bacterium]|nr:RluA family pseudouridine synthase [Tissierellia bacterium]
MKLFNNSENMMTIHVDRDGVDLEEFLKEGYDISSRLFKKMYRRNLILVNGQFQKKNIVLNKGDMVTLVVEDESDDTPPEAIPLDIVYENDDVIIINKQPYIVVHQTKSHQTNTIANGISHYFKYRGIKRKIRFVNRLDMNTSGILIVAKSAFAHQQMALQFDRREVEKKYLAVVSGVIKEDEGTIDLPIGREEDRSVRKIVTEDGKQAITKYKVIERYSDATLLDVQIFTGKSHQIRVHLSYIGHPIIGDTLYHEPHEYIDRQALHSYYLKIRLPREKEKRTFIAEMPEDMKKLIEYLKKQENL